MGCRQDTHIHGATLGPPQARDAAILQETKQLHLRSGGEFRNLIQEEGAAVCQLQIARFAACLSAGKRAFLIAEQLGFYQ